MFDVSTEFPSWKIDYVTIFHSFRSYWPFNINSETTLNSILNEKTVLNMFRTIEIAIKRNTNIISV